MDPFTDVTPCVKINHQQISGRALEKVPGGKMNSRRSLLTVVLLGVLLPVFEVPGFQAAATIQNDEFSTASPLRVLLTDAAANSGAVCLDGSPAAYYFLPGSGSGSNNWIIELEGGGWCPDTTSCLQRAGTFLGSSTITDISGESRAMFSAGIMDPDPGSNPDFYNWNWVFVSYCDGASFSGDLGTTVEMPGGSLYFRGQRIWDAVITDLLEVRGMNAAEKALLTGCSAGGLATLIHCDEFQARMPSSTFVKCFSDAGFFMDEQDVDGNYALRENFQSVVAMQNVASNLLPQCLSEKEAWQCFFPQYFIQYITTPIFIFNSGYDSWQIPNSLIPQQDWEYGTWKYCYNDFAFCTPEQFSYISGFRNDMASNISTLMTSSNKLNEGGVFVTSCRMHCVQKQNGWSSGGIGINGVTPAMAVGDWYFGRNTINRMLIDQTSPINSPC